MTGYFVVICHALSYYVLHTLTLYGEKMKRDRRQSERYRVGFHFNQVIDNDTYHCFTTDLSSIGLYSEQPVDLFARNSNIVQVELPLPNAEDSIWARAEVVYDRFDSYFHGSGLRFSAMARKHHRILQEWLRDGPRYSAEREGSGIPGSVVIVRPEKGQATEGKPSFRASHRSFREGSAV